MSVIQIRGTSGSGKSTVMRKVMENFAWTSVYDPTSKRKLPLYYCYRNLIVLGHYASPCGGCDTIGSAGQVYELATRLLCDPGRIILCEGLLLSEDTKWSIQLPSLRVLFLTTPLETCLERIKSRRAEAGNDKPLNPSNTENRVRTIERARVKLIEAGVLCRRVSSEQAPKVILSWISSISGNGLSHQKTLTQPTSSSGKRN